MIFFAMLNKGKGVLKFLQAITEANSLIDC